MPTYPDIRLALTTPGQIRRRMAAAAADHVHIVTEGPLGLLARSSLPETAPPFTTSYHTRYPEYLSARLPVPERPDLCLASPLPQRGRGDAGGDAVACRRPRRQGFHQAQAVDPRRRYRAFQSASPRRSRPAAAGLPLCRPGRGREEPCAPSSTSTCLAARSWSATGRRLPISSRATRPRTFMGEHIGEDLARIYASADVFVFPSRTDTFGIVLLEALASGLPVAAYPGDRTDRRASATAWRRPVRRSAARRRWRRLNIDRAERARQKALGYSWAACAELFLKHVRAVHARPAALGVQRNRWSYRRAYRSRSS